MTTAVIGVAGWKNSGKTTLIVRLVTELRRRGYRVATVKHAHHDFDIDKPGADSFRHRQAGAMEVAITPMPKPNAMKPRMAKTTIISGFGSNLKRIAVEILPNALRVAR